RRRKMNWETITGSKLVQDIGWTLIDSIWQIGAIALVLYLVLVLFRKTSSNFRYAMSVIALMLSFLIPAGTFVSRMQARTDTNSVVQNMNVKTGHIDPNLDVDRLGGPAG